MANLFVTEYRLPGNYRYPQLPATAVQTLSIGSTASTGACGANTNLIDIQSDAGAWLLVTSSGSTVIATATNAVRIPASVAPQRYSVSPYSRLSVLTT